MCSQARGSLAAELIRAGRLGNYDLESLLIDGRTFEPVSARRRLAIIADGLSKRGKMAEKKSGRIVETTTEARGAERGPTMRKVLAWSLGIVVVAMVIVWYVFFRT